MPQGAELLCLVGLGRGHPAPPSSMPPQVMQQISSGFKSPEWNLSNSIGPDPALARRHRRSRAYLPASRPSPLEGERRSRARSLGIPPVSRSAAPASFTIAGLVGESVAQLYSGCGRTETLAILLVAKIFGRHPPQPIDLALWISAPFFLSRQTPEREGQFEAGPTPRGAQLRRPTGVRTTLRWRKTDSNSQSHVDD